MRQRPPGNPVRAAFRSLSAVRSVFRWAFPSAWRSAAPSAFRQDQSSARPAYPLAVPGRSAPPGGSGIRLRPGRPSRSCRPRQSSIPTPLCLLRQWCRRGHPLRRYRSDPPLRTTPPRNPAPPCAGRQTAPCSRQAGTGQPPARPRGTYPSVLYTGVFSCVHPFRTLPASLSAGALQGTRPFPPPLYQYTRSMSTVLRIFVQFAVSPCVRRCTAGRNGRNGRDVGGFLKEAPKPPRTFLDYGLTGGGVDSGKAGVPPAKPEEPVSRKHSQCRARSIPGDARDEAPCMK